MKRLTCLVALALTCATAGARDAPPKKGGPHYFAGFKTKSLPEQPLRELTQKEASDRPSYYVAHYNQQGGLERFSKYSAGQLEWESVYGYSAEGRLLAGKTTSLSSGRKVTIDVEFDSERKVVRRTVREEAQ